MDEILKNNLSQKSNGKKVNNPFPGLRPFSLAETHLFFGMGYQSEQVLLKIAKNRFVAIVGTSGSGKSSLLYCGVIPGLYGGFLSNAGSLWKIIYARPGMAPIENLAESILNSSSDYHLLNDEEKVVRQNITNTILKSSSLGLIEAIRRVKKNEEENFLIVIDQFEEIFRFRKAQVSTSFDEITLFINLLLNALDSQEESIYVALTMRSDFIGECAKFPELTDKINGSHYLIPQMSRDQKRQVIEGPIAVGGGKISSRLVQQLLNDVGDNQDQLPILQHSLMRTWDYWLEHKKNGESIDLEHYQAIGTISEALSQHANEAFNELTKREQEICEILFKALTEKGNDNYGIRRPTKLSTICAIANEDEKEVIQVIEKFRQPGRSLLMPPSNYEITSDSIIDISHESLMRIWSRLRVWVEEEDEAVQMYLRLSEASANYNIGKASLWRPPDLQLALNWKQKYKPTLHWAERYNPAFERAMVFLDTSKKEYEIEQKNKDFLQKRTLRRTRNVALSLGVFAIVAILFMVLAWVQGEKAKENQKRAIANYEAAQKSAAYAEEKRIDADKKAREAEQQRQYAEVSLTRAEISEREARDAEKIANEQREIALRRTEESIKANQDLKFQTIYAQEQEGVAKEQQLRAQMEARNAYRLRILSIARAMAIKALQLNETNIKGLVARQAFLFNKEFGGERYMYDNDIYDGVYQTVKFIKGDSINQLYGHKDAVRTIAYSNNEKVFYTGGADGTIIKWTPQAGKWIANELVNFSNREIINRTLSLSLDDRWLACGTSGSHIVLFDTKNPENKPVKIAGHKGVIWDIKFMPTGATFFSTGSDSTIQYVSNNESKVIIRPKSLVRSIAISSNGRFLVGGTASGRLILWDISNNFEQKILWERDNCSIYSVDFHPDGQTIAFGDNKGIVRIWDLNTNRLVASLTGHTAWVEEVKFSNKGKFLGSASNDGTSRVWVLMPRELLNDQPIVLKHKSWMMSVAFSFDENMILTGSVDGQLRFWPTDVSNFSNMICKYLTRNMTDLEWQQYVAKDINYVETCPGLYKQTEVNQ